MRAHYLGFLVDDEGEPVTSASVTLRQSGTSTPITEEVFAADSGGAPLANPLTSGATDGKIEFYIEDPKRLDLFVEKSGQPDRTFTVTAIHTGLNFQGAYSAATTYVQFDVVTNAGETWIALRTVVGVTPVEGADWTKLAAKGADGVGSTIAVKEDGAVVGTRAGVDFIGADFDLTDDLANNDVGIALSVDVLKRTLADAKGDLLAASAADALGRLAVGSDGQVLEAAAAEALGVKWGAPHIAKSLVDAKGDIIVATGADAVARKAVGADGLFLKANSAQADGLEWAAAGAPTFVRKTADESVTSSTVLQNDDHLSLAVGANDIWVVEIQLFYVSGDGDLKIGFTGPAGAAFVWSDASLSQGASAADSAFTTKRTLGSTSSWDATKTAGVIKGIYRGGGTAGTFRLQFAQNSGNAVATTLETNSYMLATKVA